jgi:hypothetical protein
MLIVFLCNYEEYNEKQLERSQLGEPVDLEWSRRDFS